MNNWFVYILQCSDGSFYTGITTDIERRLDEHNYGNKAAKYTRGRRPLKLVYRATCKTRVEAARSEYQIRHLSRAKKLELIENACNKLAGLNRRS